MHTSVIQSPQAMSNDQSYRPRSPNLQGLTDSQQFHQPTPHLKRLPSYQIEEPSLPKGHSFSPRGSYDASPFFSQALSQQTPNSQLPTQQENSILGHSPPAFTSASLPNQDRAYSPISYGDIVQGQQEQHDINTFQQSPSQLSPVRQSVSQSFHPSIDEMARLRSCKPVNYNEDHNGSQYEDSIPNFQQPPTMQQMPPQPQQLSQHTPSQQFMQPPMSFGPPMHAPAQRHQLQQQQQPLPPTPSTTMSPMFNIDVKTKFPVARIKRIMQADEDVGKVAQATPTAVSKALEMFMIALVTKGAAEAKNNNGKRVTATHLKHALLTDPQFDFLNEICEAVPDEGGKGSKGRAKSEAKSEDSDEDMGGALKKKTKAGRKRKGGDDEGSD